MPHWDLRIETPIVTKEGARFEKLHRNFSGPKLSDREPIRAVLRNGAAPTRRETVT